MFETTCFDVWRKEVAAPKIITLIKDLDKYLEGGISVGLITELCGGPGVGKTQLCLQLCINIQFPESVSGMGAKAFYIDTTKDFSPYRLKEIAEGIYQNIQNHLNKSQTTIEEDFNVNFIMTNINYVYCANYKELMTEIYNLRNLLEHEKKLKLIIVDSFSFVIRSLENIDLRTQCCYQLINEMQCIAREFNVAFVITNELTTRCQNNKWYVAPALGDLHSHKINQRLILNRDISGNHYLTIDKSSICEKLSIRCEIKNNGVRGV